MKIIASILAVLLLSTNAPAQSRDTISHPWGLFFDYDYSVIDYLGVKYRVDSRISLFTRLNYSFVQRDPEDPQYYPDGTDNEFSCRIGLEYKVLQVEDISLFIQGGAGLIWAKNERTGNIDGNLVGTAGSKHSIYEIVVGVGAEYFISPRFSIFGYQTIVGSLTKYSTIAPIQPDKTTKTTSIDLGVAKLGLCFYF